jgi:hypothetical protein
MERERKDSQCRLVGRPAARDCRIIQHHIETIASKYSFAQSHSDIPCYARFEHLCGKSAQMACHEPLAHQNDFFKSGPIRPDQVIFSIFVPVSLPLNNHTIALGIRQMRRIPFYHLSFPPRVLIFDLWQTIFVPIPMRY